MGRVTICLAALAMIGALLGTAHAFTKCQRASRVLYTQDLYCPTGYSPIASTAVGTVSTIGKSEGVHRQEQEYLEARASTSRAGTQNATATTSVQAQPQAAACDALAEQARAVEASMRRPNPSSWQDNLRQQHRGIRDQQYRMGC
ncbi:hypothetical protein [Cupriavidus pauculus]|uniref:DUF4124 domain-containing protein n=1 Tax=Cupriavidus pauculus TaxID=82633 RepID=A0A3G8H951_9BURK|nr:hypothetical protein [Cupriavidus pauculus]AZG17117.1 hypothetical protein EHF44_26940 [Cupriavidus pauculus]